MANPSIQITPSSPERPLSADLSLAYSPAVSIQAVTRFTLIFGVIHSLLWCACIGLLVLHVPQAERVLKDFNMTLPTLTQFVLKLSRWADTYFLLIPFVLGSWLLFDVAVLGYLRLNNRRAAWTWGLLNILLPLLFGALILFAMEMPMVKLLEGLSR